MYMPCAFIITFESIVKVLTGYGPRKELNSLTLLARLQLRIWRHPRP